jgi:plasmid rolling circle replication initiator protein Rep
MQNYQLPEPSSSPCQPPASPFHGGVGNQAQNDPYFLIQGNKSSTPHKQGLCGSDLSTCADDHQERLAKYAVAHKRAIAMSNWIKENRLEKNERLLATLLKDCGDYLIFRGYYTVNQMKLHGMTSCKKHILCPLCAIRRGAKSVSAYLDRLKVIKETHGEIKAFLVTFTVKNGEDLQERFHHLQTSMKNYNLKRSRANTSGKHLPVEANKALGAVWSYEFKVGEGSGLWHPHAHAVWLCYDTPDQEQLQREWLEITGDSFIVNVTPFHDQADVVGGFLEVFKYAVKFSNMPLEQNWHGYEILQGRRLVASFGLFRGVQIPESLTDEPLESLPYWEMFYRYQKCGAYKMEHSVLKAPDLPF